MKRLLATILWVPLMATVIITAMLGGLLIGAAALMIPFVKYVAAVGDGER